MNLNPKISVIICTRNRPGDVSQCLPTVLAALRDDWEVLLVDQSDGTETQAVAARLSAACPALRYLPTKTRGKSHALNLALAETDGPLLAFTDDDCDAPPDWLEKIAAEFAAEPNIDVLFGQVLPSPAIPDLDSVCVPAWAFSDSRDLRLGEVCGMGANMALRRTALLLLPRGLVFDPAMGPGGPFPAGEEGDFVYRLRRAGARAALRPALTLWHRAWRTPDHWASVLQQYGVGEAAFFAKHARCGDAWAVRRLLAALLHLAARAGAKAALRRPNNDAALLGGLCRGFAASLRVGVDPRTRLYRAAEAER